MLWDVQKYTLVYIPKRCAPFDVFPVANSYLTSQQTTGVSMFYFRMWCTHQGQEVPELVYILLTHKLYILLTCIFRESTWLDIGHFDRCVSCTEPALSKLSVSAPETYLIYGNQHGVVQTRQVYCNTVISKCHIIC